MRKRLIIQLFAAALLATTNVHAQSLKDLFNKANVEKVINAVTEKKSAPQLEGTWNYTGAAVQFESDNLLAKAGGAAASSALEKKVNEQLAKVGINSGQTSYTFNADSTFTTTVGSRKLKGTYSYNADTEKLTLKFARLLPLNATLNYTSTSIDLLFDADKLLKLIAYIGNKSNSATLKSVSTLANNYDGMLTGMSLKKEE